MSWTDDRVELLKRLWAEGYSASQIAGQLAGGVTRNAVIGKVHRLGLSGRARPQAQHQTTQRRTSPIATSHRPSMRPAVIGNTALKLEVAQMPFVAPEVETEIVVESVPHGPRVTILTLTEYTCKWPIGDPSKADFHFCGRRSETGMPYCGHHARIAYQPLQDRRRDRRVASGA
jgi:GcrA cell cycle regulator